jgi:hypothetical protein
VQINTPFNPEEERKEKMTKGNTRVSRGYKPNLCVQCRTGIRPNQIKLFDPGCEGCHAKKAVGLRTGNEPAPKRRLGEKFIDYEKLARQKAARARAAKKLLKVIPSVPQRHKKGSKNAHSSDLIDGVVFNTSVREPV